MSIYLLISVLVALIFGYATFFGKYDNIKSEKATIGGGCFWCMEPPYDKIEGVLETEAGYMGGMTIFPTYEEISSGDTGHAEVVQITFNPLKVSYQTLLDTFWKNINPTTLNQQFMDRGSQYRTVIFYHSDEQKRLAEVSKQTINHSGKFKAPIVTEIKAATDFYPAEDYHQDYYHKNPLRYKFYKMGSGRQDYLKRTWPEDNNDDDE